MSIKFEVPYNGDSKLVDFYKENAERISWVYGRAEDKFPQGRDTSKSRPVSIEDIEKEVPHLRDSGIGFNYLLNGTNQGNREFNLGYRRKFVSFVKDLAARGIRGVTIGNPFLMETVREKVPEIEIFASILLEVDNLARLEQIIRAGADYVCLSKTLLKNFEGLERIAKFARDKTKLVLLANDPCLHHCAYTGYHNMTLSEFTSSGGDYVNYCRMHCNQDFASDARKVISASFIRPEDLGAYEELGFVFFKLCERKQTTDWITNAVRAYFQRSYNGDLSDIMAPWSNIGQRYPDPKALEESDLAEGFDKIRANIRFQPSISNPALDGYLDYWRKIKRNGCSNEDCDACNYCAEIAKKAYLPREGKNQTIVKNLDLAMRAARKT